MRLVSLVIVLVTGVLAWSAGAQWVTVHLKSGDVYSGTVVEETAHKIVIEVYHGSLKSNMTIAASDVQRVERAPADEEPIRPLDEVFDQPASGQRRGVVVVPAKGGIGQSLTSNFFRSCIEEADEANAELVVFHLTSPGGYLLALREIRDAIADRPQQDLEVAFFVDGECFSAAAMLCMAQEHFYVGERASFGAAVIIQGDGLGGFNAVDAKFASAEAATWRGFAERAGRPGLLVDAMMIQSIEVWADKSKDPWALARDATTLEAGELIDSRETVLSMTSRVCIASGASDGFVRRPEALAYEVGIDDPEFIAASGEQIARDVLRQQTRNIRELNRRFEAAGATLARALAESKRSDASLSIMKTEMRRLRKIYERMRDMYDSLDYARFYLEAEYGITRESFDTAIDALTELGIDGPG
ncbi:MAG: hypothetical protein AAGD00_09085 [Planctomycetota bacterium]